MVKAIHYQTLRARSFISREGVSLLGISDAGEAIGFRTSGVYVSFEQFITDVPVTLHLTLGSKPFCSLLWH